MTDNLIWLQNWYDHQCDGSWEHTYGINIDTLDNPGWSLTIDLAETQLGDVVVPRAEVHRSEEDWLVYEIKDQQFVGYCGVLNLDELIGAFRTLCASRSLA